MPAPKLEYCHIMHVYLVLVEGVIEGVKLEHCHMAMHPPGRTPVNNDRRPGVREVSQRHQYFVVRMFDACVLLERRGVDQNGVIRCST